MGKALSHFITITRHRHMVRHYCFQIGLYWQGMTHDLSKYSFTEFLVGAKYYQGDRSPNNAEREAIGYSSAWLHHKGRNKHHYEYWIDYSKDSTMLGGIVPVAMPKRYVAEMIMDRIAASKVYKGADYTDESPLEYYNSGKEKPLMHDDTMALLEQFLHMLAEKGEKETLRFIREEFLRSK